jgi:hypothetical protein
MGKVGAGKGPHTTTEEDTMTAHPTRVHPQTHKPKVPGWRLAKILGRRYRLQTGTTIAGAAAFVLRVLPWLPDAYVRARPSEQWSLQKLHDLIATVSTSWEKYRAGPGQLTREGKIWWDVATELLGTQQPVTPAELAALYASAPTHGSVRK